MDSGREKVFETQSVSTNCRLCGYLCGLEAKVKQGKVIKLSPDPTRYPYRERIIKACPRFHSNQAWLDHPDRLNYPHKRAGSRGDGKWERISWTQALDEIAEKLEVLKSQIGPETLATSIGAPHTVYWPVHRFMNMFGSPNNIGIGQICWNPAVWIDTLTFGWPLHSEIVLEQTNCVIVWGMNPAASDNSLFWRTLIGFSQKGGKLIVVDPRRTKTARIADLWLPIQPGTDAALALGFLHVAVKEKLYDAQFVDKYCDGFDALEEQVEQYSPMKVANITGVSPKEVLQAAHLFFTGQPSAVFTGRAVDQIGANSLPTHRAVALMKALSGNVDRRGASHLGESPQFKTESELELMEHLSEDQKEKQLGREDLFLQTYDGHALLNRLAEKKGKTLPQRYLSSVHPDLAWKAMIRGEPYPIKALIVMGSNPLTAHADTKRVYEALMNLDLLVVLELCHTPTTMLADYILPIAGSLERPVLQTDAGTANTAYGGAAAVEASYERRTDYAFWRELGLRMGQEEYWPWETMEESFQAIINPLPFTWKEFCQEGGYFPPRRYQKHKREEKDSDVAFATPTGKIELFSSVLNEVGADPLPHYHWVAGVDENFPLKLITGVRKQPYYGSAFRQVNELRKIHPKPLAEMSKRTAEENNVDDGDAVWVETERGRAMFWVKTCEMRDNLVSVEYGWWYPEQERKAPKLGGLWLSNANILTSANFEESDPVLGQWKFNGLVCRVIPANEKEDRVQYHNFLNLGSDSTNSCLKCGDNI